MTVDLLRAISDAKPPAWHEDALCARSHIPLAVWRGEDRDELSVYDAKCVCWRCPVIDECRKEADKSTADNLAGIWAGESDTDRRGKKGRPRKNRELASSVA